MVPEGQSYSAHVPLVIGAIMVEGCRTATRYVTPKFVVKCTRSNRWSLRANSRNVTLLVTFGAPNYAERAFIKDALAAGEPFPIKRVQLRYYPERVKERKAEKIARKVKAGKPITDRERKTLAASALRQ